MRHEFTSADRTCGRWLVEEDPTSIYCGWSWSEDAMELYVNQGINCTSYKPPQGNREALDRFLRNLPDIALRLANKLEKQQRLE